MGPYPYDTGISRYDNANWNAYEVSAYRINSTIFMIFGMVCQSSLRYWAYASIWYMYDICTAAQITTTDIVGWQTIATDYASRLKKDSQLWVLMLIIMTWANSLYVVDAWLENIFDMSESHSLIQVRGRLAQLIFLLRITWYCIE